MSFTIRFLIVCFLCQSLPVSAAWYQVELIVFRHLSPDTDGEVWYENPGLPERNQSIELISDLAEAELDATDSEAEIDAAELSVNPNRELIPYLQLPSAELKLGGIQRVLKLSSEYRPLMHIAWQQPALRADSARPVHLQQYEDSSTLKHSEAIQEPEDIESLINQSSDELDIYEVPELIFDGTIKLRSSKFLHADIDFAFFPVDLGEDSVSQATDDGHFVLQEADYVRLTESRKIRLNEIHYFDHPYFGVILRVSRLKIR